MKNELKTILKVIMILALFIILLQIVRALGFITLAALDIKTNMGFGVNAKTLMEIFAFATTLFLSVKSFKSKKYFNWTVIIMGTLFMVLIVIIAPNY